MKPDKKTFLFGVTGLLAATTLVSRILGFVREMIFASFFGTTYAASAYKAAYNIPDFIRTLFLSGVISAVFIPIFTEYRTKYNDEEANKLAINILNIVLTIGSIITAIGILLSPFIVKLIYHGFYGETYKLTVILTEVLFPILMILSVNGIVMGTLHSYNHFTVPAITPIINNIIIIAGAFIICPKWGVKGYAICVLVADIIHLLINILTFRKYKVNWRSIFQLKHPAFLKMLYAAPTAILCFAPFFINSLIDKVICSPIEMKKEGAIAALSYAFMVQQLPYSVFAVAVATAFYPTLSYQVAEKKLSEFKSTLSEGIRMIFFTIIPCSAALIFLSRPVIRLLFEHGEFDANSTMLTAKPLAGYCLGLFGGSSVQLILRAYFSLKDYITPAKVGLIMITLNIIADLILIVPLSHTGIAVATSVIAPLNMITLLILLRKKIGSIGARRIFTCFAKAVISAVSQGFVSLLIFNFLSGKISMEGKFHQMIVVGTSLAVGGLAYLIISYLLKMEELKGTITLVKKLFSNKKSN